MSGIALACWAVRRVADPCARAFLLAAATLLATPYAFNYDMTAIGAALVWIMVGRLPYRAEAGPIYMLAWLAPPPTMMLALYGSGLAPLIMFFVLSSTFAVAVLDATSPEPRQLAAV